MRGALLGLLWIILPESVAAANPFPLEPGRVALDLSINLDFASAQWTGRGDYEPLTLGGAFSSQLILLGARYGLAEGLEAQVRVGYKIATYTAAPLHLFSPRVAQPGAGSLTEEVFNFSGQETGFADIYAGASYRLLRRGVNLAIESEVKLPTGYRAPTGTLCASVPPDEVQRRILASVARPMAPQLRPRDFCSPAGLGDGQVDWLIELELGKYIPRTRTFFRAEAGVNLRFQGPGQQVVAGARLGENLLDRVVVYLGARLAYTVNAGAPVGTTINSVRPDAAPDEYPIDQSGVVLLRPDVATRDHDYLVMDAGLIVRLLQSVELRGNYSRALWGRNFPALNSVAVGVAFATP